MARVDIDEDDARRGLLALVVALVEVVHEVLKRQAARRMVRGTLSLAEVDRVGRSLMALERVLEDFKREQELHAPVQRVHEALDAVVEDLLEAEVDPGGPSTDGSDGSAGAI